jgi:hypothetical protein
MKCGNCEDDLASMAREMMRAMAREMARATARGIMQTALPWCTAIEPVDV